MRKRIAWVLLACTTAALCSFTASAVTLDAEPRAPTKAQILSSIHENLVELGSFQAQVSCISSDLWGTFAGGRVYGRGGGEYRLDMGTSGKVLWHNSFVLNHVGVDGETVALRWTDTKASAIDFLVNETGGLEDVRKVMVLIAWAPDLAASPRTEVVAGVACRRMSGMGLNLWVDAANLQRVVQCERLYEDPKSVAFRATYSGWRVRNGVADLPDEVRVAWYAPDGVVYRSWEYSLSNIEIGIPLSEKLFAVKDAGKLKK